LLCDFHSAAVGSVWAEIRGQTPLHLRETGELPRRIVMTFVWFLFTLVLAIFIPNIKTVISFLGALAAIFMFIFPGRFWNYEFWDIYRETAFFFGNYHLYNRTRKKLMWYVTSHSSEMSFEIFAETKFF